MLVSTRIDAEHGAAAAFCGGVVSFRRSISGRLPCEKPARNVASAQKTGHRQ